jgi:hypothetical protein
MGPQPRGSRAPLHSQSEPYAQLDQRGRRPPLDKSLVSLVESSDDRRVRVVSLTEVVSERVEGMFL